MVKCHSSFTIAEQVEVSHFKRKKEPFFLIIILSVNVLCEWGHIPPLPPPTVSLQVILILLLLFSKTQHY